MFFQKCCFSNKKCISTPSFRNYYTQSQHSRISKDAYRDICKIEDSKDIIVIKDYEEWNMWSDNDAEEDDEEYFKNKAIKSKYDNGNILIPNNSQKSDGLWHRGTSSDESCQKIPKSSSNKFLDWISMCFWKCTPGCQQLPSISI